MDYKGILEAAKANRPQMSRFLRDLIAIPGESGKEERVVRRIAEEMNAVGFDRVETDAMGNLLGTIGSGKHLIAYDAHIDTVGVGNRDLWEFDPFLGYEDDEVIGGRGASDQLGGMAAMVYAGKVIKELDLARDAALLFTGTVQEEDCDGLCWQFMIKESGIRPDFVVITEPTSCNVYRGQRGRMEIRVSTSGRSCHGSAPERGENAIYKMAPILKDLEELNGRLGYDPFLGKGSLTVSEIFFTSPSRCAVADGCSVSIDRRLTAGESGELALEQIRSLPSVVTAKAEVSMYGYDAPSWKGLRYPSEAYFPTWLVGEGHPVCSMLQEACEGLFGGKPEPGKWTFSTNGVSIMGKYGIPCIGFGPGHEDQAHAPNEKTWKDELVKAAAVYAAIPLLYTGKYACEMPGSTE